MIVDAAIVGTRIYPHYDKSAAKILPFIVYSRISSDHQRHMSAGSGLVSPRIQLDIYSESYTEVKAIADSVRAALHTYSDTVTIGADSVTLQSVSLDAQHDDFDQPRSGKRSAYYRVIQDYIIWHDELVP